MAMKIEIRQESRNSTKLQQVLAVALMCSLVIFFLMSVCLMSSYWITADGFRQGLLYLCIEETSPISRIQSEPLPFDLSKDELMPGCYPNRDVGKFISQRRFIDQDLSRHMDYVTNQTHCLITLIHAQICSLSEDMHNILSNHPVIRLGLSLLIRSRHQI
jgi:hypothetical protein